MMHLPVVTTLHQTLRNMLLASLGLAILVGCGFKLRGAISVDLPFKTVYVSGVPDTSPFAQVLKAQLRANGIGVMQRLATIRVPAGTVLTAPKKQKSDMGSTNSGKSPAANSNQVLTTPTGMQPLGGMQ